MKFLYIALLACAVFLVSGSVVCSEELLRLTSGEWPPYMSENMQYLGLGSKIVSEAFVLEGVRVSYGFFPRKRSLFEARLAVEWDGSILWFRSPEIEKEFYVSEPVIESKFVFFHLKDRPFEWKTIDDLKKYSIGGTLEYDYGDEFTQAEKEGKIRVERVPNDEQNFKKLLFGRIDISPQDIDVGLFMIKNMKPEEAAKLTYNPTVLRSGPVCLLLSKKNVKNKKYIELFNKGLRKLKDSGEYARILSPVAPGKTIIVANKSVKETQLSRDEIKAIFLGRKTQWTDSKTIRFVMLRNNKESESFIRNYVGMSLEQYNNYWDKLFYTGNALHLQEFDNEKDLADFISRTEGGVGFISSEVFGGNLKKIEVK